MTYAQRWGGGFADDNPGTPIDSTFLNAVEDALLKLFGIAPTVNGVPAWDGARFRADALVKNANIDAAAAISKSKLAALSIVDADVAAGAAIAKSKLALTGQIVDADVAGSAAIAASKIVGVPNAFKVAGTYDSVNNTNENSLISGALASASTGWQIPANALGPNGAIRVTIIGDYLNNSGGAVTETVRIKFGGTTFYGQATGGIGASANRYPFFFQFVLTNLGATNSNYLMGLVPAWAGGTPSAASIAGVTAAAADGSFGYSAVQAIDTTAAKFLDVTVQHTTGAATISARRHLAVAEYIL